MTVRIAFKALGRNKLRTSLTTLGMIIGVAAVITMVALGSGAQDAIEEQIRGAGTNMITLFPGAAVTAGVQMGQGSSTKLTPDDAKALRDLPEVLYVSEAVQTRQQVIAGSQNTSSNIVGVNVDYTNIKSWPMKSGSFFTEYDVQTTAKVCTLGSNVADTLFGEDVDPTGSELRIRNQLFKVLGVMAPKGSSSSGQNQDDQVFAPYTTVMRRLQGQEFLNYILAGARSSAEVRHAADAIAAEMRERHDIPAGGDDDFRVQTQDDLIAVRAGATQTMTSLLAGIAGVSLLVGGIGIMNIMLVSVTERTREIGLRLAIGARGRDVLTQFLVEAIVISLAGGAMGVALGYGASDFVTWSQQWPTHVDPNSILTAFAVAGLTGVFFGFYPATKAAALDPIEALRFE